MWFAAVALGLTLAWGALPGAAGRVSAQQPVDGAQRVMRLVSAYQVVPNLVYRVASGTELKLDIYRPAGLQTPNPTVMFFHLGGWTTGTKEAALFSLLPWMDMGFTVLNVEYRLTDTAVAPAALEDAVCALRWVYRNQRQYNFDVTKLVTTGQSAGGHLALAIAMLPASAGMESTCPGDRTGNASATGPTNSDPMKVAAVVDQYGIPDVTDLLSGPNARSFATAWLGVQPNREALAKLVSPSTYVQAGAPPIFSVHGDADPTVPYPLKQKFHALLEQEGLAHELFTVAGGRHGGWTEDVNVRLYAAIRSFLGKHGVLPAASSMAAQ
jgi:acetyl esterase/lipase